MPLSDKQTKTLGGVVGGLFTALVVGLLALLHASPVTVPLLHSPLAPKHDIYVCRTAPSKYAPTIPRAEDFWRAHDVLYGHTFLADPCMAICAVATDPRRLVACHPGAITVDLRDRAFSDEHAGETVFGVRSDGSLAWATILLPAEIPSYDVNAGVMPPALPSDVYALALAHELGHAEGYGHSTTKVVKGVHAEKTGELMNAHVFQWGWGDAGLP